jgi:hypothetical protein
MYAEFQRLEYLLREYAARSPPTTPSLGLDLVYAGHGAGSKALGPGQQIFEVV